MLRRRRRTAHCIEVHESKLKISQPIGPRYSKWWVLQLSSWYVMFPLCSPNEAIHNRDKATRFPSIPNKMLKFHSAFVQLLKQSVFRAELLWRLASSISTMPQS